jgi:hypothetical protein
MSSALYGRDAQARAVLALLAGDSGAAVPVPRTVGYHLYKAYPKLDVSARSQLAALIAGQGTAGRG